MLKRLREQTPTTFREVGKVSYPADHKPGMKVPKGGSSCSNCKFLKDDKKSCGEPNFVKWNGSPIIPGRIDSYCSDWYMPGKVKNG